MTDRTEILALAKRIVGFPNAGDNPDSPPIGYELDLARAVVELAEDNEEREEYLHTCGEALADAGIQLTEGAYDGITTLTNERDELREELSKEKHEAVCAETVARNYAAERDRLREELRRTRRTHEEMNHEKHLKIMELTETARLANKKLSESVEELTDVRKLNVETNRENDIFRRERDRAEKELAELTRKDKQLCEQNGSLLMELAIYKETHRNPWCDSDETEKLEKLEKELAALKAEIKAAPELRNTYINGQVFRQSWSTTKTYGDTHRCLGFRIEPLEKP